MVMENFKQNLLCRDVLIRIAICLVISIIYGILNPPFLLRFIDAFSVCGFILLAIGLAVIFYKDGSFSFFSWKHKEKSWQAHQQEIKKARMNQDNDCLYASLPVLALSLFLTILYVLTH